MKILVKTLLILKVYLLVHPAHAKEWDSFSIFPPLKQVYHPVSTTNKEAQTYFDLGLLSIYAFNHEQAYLYFEQAAKLDPSLAMAYWGMALSLGENLNKPIDDDDEKKAFFLMREALFRLNEATENEKGYIRALSLRYSNALHPDRTKLREAYKKEMEELVRNYPDDEDAATLYAESMMDLKPWRLWTIEGDPEPGTLEIVAALESVLKRNPEHVGANHYYIHAVEASKNPERALMSAYRLYDLWPEWGHLLHMPSHIFLLMGDYEMAQKSNQQAIAADKAYIQKHGSKSFYIQHYLAHNFYFLVRSFLWQERPGPALETAKELQVFLKPHLTVMPELEYYMLAPLQVYIYSHNWEAILKTPKPTDEFLGFLSFWHFARSLAFLQLNDVSQASLERDAFLKAKERVPPTENLGLNSAKTVLAIAQNLLDFHFAYKRGEKETALRFLEGAVQEQDTLYYNEPPDWFYPMRQSLGAFYLKERNYPKAEAIFRKALNKYPRNGRSLFGLFYALQAQYKPTYWVEREMKSALRNSEKELTLQDL